MIILSCCKCPASGDTIVPIFSPILCLFFRSILLYSFILKYLQLLTQLTFLCSNFCLWRVSQHRSWTLFFSLESCSPVIFCYPLEFLDHFFAVSISLMSIIISSVNARWSILILFFSLPILKLSESPFLHSFITFPRQLKRICENRIFSMSSSYTSLDLKEPWHLN